MGLWLARIGRYWDCFEEVDEYEIEVSKVKKIRKIKKEAKNQDGISESEHKDDKELDLSNMQKLKPGKAVISDNGLQVKNVVLDQSMNNELDKTNEQMADSSLAQLKFDQDPYEDTKGKLLKRKLQNIRQRRKMRELEQREELGIPERQRKKREHVLNIHNNDEFFIDKEQLNEYGKEVE